MAGEAEVGFKTAESAPSYTTTTFTTDQSKASKKKQTWRVGRLGPETEAGTGIRVVLTHDLYLRCTTHTQKHNMLPQHQVNITK